MKAYTDLEQSKKLAEILPPESADCYWFKGFPSQPYMVYTKGTPNPGEHIPCWSLAALLDYLSANFRVDIKYLENHWEFDCRVRVAYNKELVDACCELLLKLHKQNIL